MTVKIGISGITGRMGQELMMLASLKPNLYEVYSGHSRKDGIGSLNDMCQNSDVVIDFSSSEGIEELIKTALVSKTRLVIGTTGLSDYHFDLIKNASSKIAIIYAPNTSLGASLMADLATKAASILNDDFDIDIIDIHHKHKKDAPSGTSLMLGREIAKAKGIKFSPTDATCHPRKAGDIGFSSIRSGGIVGEHEVIFASNSEVITIKHQALNRSMFAEGALKAARWLSFKEAGLYSMQDVLS